MPCTPPEAGVEFNEPTLNASPCAFAIDFRLPVFTLNLQAPPFPPPFLPSFNLSLKLSCNLDEPVDVSAGIAPGGGRLPCFDESPDDEDD